MKLIEFVTCRILMLKKTIPNTPNSQLFSSLTNRMPMSMPFIFKKKTLTIYSNKNEIFFGPNLMTTCIPIQFGLPAKTRIYTV
ncbi:hypothetical protein DERP_005765 [Dermatophagoides pteronyssinus]|uniref:Uncharacterized protein n=1 Tax=Dermatophagoides pteronyssinus TaxID=6956 RepID=A0ABQ8J9G6_DERPT|nr:hypothetical protein DERP_005765 [Dermatophagoides pteronyssinus]